MTEPESPSGWEAQYQASIAKEEVLHARSEGSAGAKWLAGTQVVRIVALAVVAGCALVATRNPWGIAAGVALLGFTAFALGAFAWQAVSRRRHRRG